MAKSQLEIVLVDESDGSAPAPTPTTEAVQSSSAGVPARQPAGSTAAATPEKPMATSTAREAREPSATERRPERRDTTAIDVAGRVAEMTVRAFGLGNLVGEIQRWQQILRDVGGLFKSSATSRVESEAPRVQSHSPVEQTAERTESPPRSESQQPARRQQQPEEQQAEHPAFASVKHFMRVTAPKAFGDFTSGAVDAIRTFFGGPDSDDQPTPTAVPSRPAATAARDDRQQPITVKVKQEQDNGKDVSTTGRAAGRVVQGASDFGDKLDTYFKSRKSPTASSPPTEIPLRSIPKAADIPAVAPKALPVPTAAPAGSMTSMPVAAVAPATTAVPAVAPTAVAAASSAASVVSSSAPAATGAATGTTAGTAVATGATVTAAGAALAGVATGAIAVVAGLAALLIGAKKLSSVLGEATQKVAGYSVHVSAATAESEVRSERSMMERGARIGPQLAQFERSRSRLEERFMSMGTDILEILLQLWQTLEPFVEKSVSVAEAGVAGMGVVAADLQLIIDILTPWNGIDFAGGMDRIAKAGEKMDKQLAEVLNGEAEKNDPLENEFLEAFMGLGAGMASKLGGPAAPRRRARGGGP